MSSIVTAVQETAGIVATVTLSYALFDWLTSGECETYLAKLRSVKTARNIQYHKYVIAC